MLVAAYPLGNWTQRPLAEGDPNLQLFVKFSNLTRYCLGCSMIFRALVRMWV